MIAIITGIFVALLLGGWHFKPLLYSKYYMPKLIVRSSDGRVAFKVYQYPFRIPLYAQYSKFDDSFKRSSNFDLSRNFLSSTVAGETIEERLIRYTGRYLKRYEPRVYKYFNPGHKTETEYKEVTSRQATEYRDNRKQELLQQMLDENTSVREMEKLKEEYDQL